MITSIHPFIDTDTTVRLASWHSHTDLLDYMMSHTEHRAHGPAAADVCKQEHMAHAIDLSDGW